MASPTLPIPLLLLLKMWSLMVVVTEVVEVLLPIRR